MPTITGTIAAGENPYSIENQPARASVYPVLYNVLVAPFTLALGNTLELHRAINGICILGSCALLFFASRRAGGSRTDSFAGAALLYAGLLFHSTPIASPNGLGLLLFLASIITPWRFGFSDRSLVAAMLFGVLAFYSKQYFLASLGYVALYMFIAVSKKKAVIFGLLSLLLTIGSLFVVHSTSPYFIDNTVFSQMYAGAAIGSSDTTVKQLLEYFWMYLPILLVLALIVLQSFFKKSGVESSAHQTSTKQTRLTDLDSPLLSRPPNYFLVCFFCSLAIIVLVIGKNPANHMTYLLQLMSPFLIIAIFSRTSHTIKPRWLYQALAVVTFYNAYAVLPANFSPDEDNWKRLQSLVSESNKTYAPALLVTEILGSGGEIYQNSHTPYFAFAQLKPSIFEKDYADETVAVVWKNYVDGINELIAKQEFDLIILDTWSHLPLPLTDLQTRVSDENFLVWLMTESTNNDLARLRGYYQRAEVISVDMGNRPGGEKITLQIWKPVRRSE